MGAALALAGRTRGRTAPNPNVGCVLVADGRVFGRGWTQPGGRPHAEAMALAEAGAKSRGATCYTTLEPCAHRSTRGPACADLLVAAGVARVVAALRDPDPRTDGAGLARLAAAGIAVESGLREDEARLSLAGFLTRRSRGRPFVTLKLATSLDGAIALSSGESRWITGAAARAHAHLERSRHEAILVGRGTWEADRPALDVRLAGLEARAPQRVVLSATRPSRHPSGSWGLLPESATHAARDPSFRWGDDEVAWLTSPHAIADLPGDHLLVEGGAGAAAAFLAADLVDRLVLYRAPIVIGGGRASVGDLGLGRLDGAHGRWRLADRRTLAPDTLETYARVR